MRRDRPYISYSGWKLYRSCNFAYWNSYVNKTEVEAPDDRLGSVYGSVVGILFEDFYRLKIWKESQPMGCVSDRIDQTVKKVVGDIRKKGGVLMWRDEDTAPKAMYASVEELKADVEDAVSRGFRIIKASRLLGPRTETEVKLDSVIDGCTIGGRADFIIKRTAPHRDLCIIDGKGSKHREKYVDVKQLRWYEMLFRHKGEVPDKIGFLFWRCEPDDAFDWYEPSQVECDDLLRTVLGDLKDIETKKKTLGGSTGFEEARKVFLPKAEEPGVKKKDIGEACRFCQYAVEEICPEGHRFLEGKKA